MVQQWRKSRKQTLSINIEIEEKEVGMRLMTGEIIGKSEYNNIRVRDIKLRYTQTNQRHATKIYLLGNNSINGQDMLTSLKTSDESDNGYHRNNKTPGRQHIRK